MAELFKFRCYHCQKLIGTPPSKFGKVVKCPRCEVELIVPSPEGIEPEPEPTDPNTFRPEDFGIKIETERLTEPRSVASSPSTSVLEPVGPDPIAFLKQVSEATEPENIDSPEPSDSEEAPDQEVSSQVLPEPQVEPLIPRTRGRGIASRAEALPRARDVVLPRTAAVAWAMFGILGLAFAFIAGLLLGHFLWK
jgi:hypothetical protein